MEIYKAKGQVIYQSNITNSEKIDELIYADTQNNIIDPIVEKAGIALEIDQTESDYIKTIEVQNEKLREISWIQSHVVRSPLARIMGLIQIIKDLKYNDETGTILEYILLSADELDNAIKEISDKSIPVLY